LAIYRSPGSQAPRAHSTCPEDWSLTECVRILRRRKATLLWVTCLAVAITGLVTIGQSRVYQSRASLEVQAFNENFLNLRDIYPTAASSTDLSLYVQTQAELIQQDSLLEQVARQLHLEERPEFQPASTTLNKLRQHIRIVPLRNSRIIQIVGEARDAPLAADLANTLARTFIDQTIETRQRAAAQTYESLRSQLGELRPGLLKQEARAAQSGTDRLRMPVLPKLDTNRRLYEALLQKADDARMAAEMRQSNIRLVGLAEPATRPYKPNLPLNLIIGTLGGFVVAIGCVMLQEQNTSVLHSPGEAGRHLALPELGAIPSVGAWKPSPFGFRNSSNGKLHIERAMLEQRSSYLSESFRTTLASILSAPHNGDHPHNLVFTSTQPMEGKTTLVTNLGFALAEIGRKVLLVDGDMRRPRLHRIFDEANEWGLSDVLREWDSIEGLPLKLLVKKTAVPDIYLLPGGVSTDNILGLLHSGRMSKLLARFREEFDYVLVDTPPCLEFGDARNLARFADGLVLVVRAGHTERKMAEAAVQRLECDGIRVTGVVLNGWDTSRGGPYCHSTFRSSAPAAYGKSTRKDWEPIA
jgi:succinoglycan biosynthesis transport protein ExoP